MTVSKTCRSG